MSRIRLISSLVLVCSFILASLVLTPTPALAATIVVTDCTGTGFGNVVAAASPNDVITFDCPDNVIDFWSGDVISVNTTLTIDGSNSGNQIILDGNQQTNFFAVSGNLTIQHLTMQNGYSDDSLEDGAVYTVGEAVVTIVASTFDNNHARHGGAVYSDNGSVVISHSTFTNNRATTGGGAIFSAKVLQITQSTFLNNHAGGGGGAIIAAFGPIHILSSTFVGNTSGTEGDIYGRGSAIDLWPTYNATTVAWSTIIQPEDANHPAIFIHDDAELNLTGVILGGHGEHCDGSPLVGDSYTLSNDDSCGLSGTGSHEGVSDLGLADLRTITIDGVEQSFVPLLAGSPAIDAAPACDTDVIDGPDPDQLGQPRPAGSACDIGAVEGFIYYPATLCANKWTGALRMTGSCNRAEVRIELPEDGPLSLCVNAWNGATRLGPACSRSETTMMTYGTHTISSCVNRYNATLRIASTCTRSEVHALL